MGTSQDAIRNSNPELAYVLVIEGYKYLLTDGNASDAVTAWAATDWSDALPGLEVSGSFRQSLAPWSNELEVPHFTFSVLPEVTDQFGIDMFKNKPSIRSELTVSFDTGDHAGGFNMVVKNAAQFSDATPVFVGNESFNVTGTPAGNNIPIPAAGSGYLAPFGTDAGAANTFPGPHAISAGANIGAYGAKSPVYVTDSPPSWLGKKVGLFVHRVSGGVWDVKAQAEVLFAGTISNIGESGLKTVVDCEGIQKSLLDATLMQDQWSGRLKEGYSFQDGDFVQISYYRHSVSSGGVSAKFTAATGAGADEFESGIYSAAEFGALLASHLDGDATLGEGSSFAMRWSCNVVAFQGGQKFQILATAAASVDATISIRASDILILNFLGFEQALSHGDEGLSVAGGLSVFTGTDTPLVSDSAPYRIMPVGVLGGESGTSVLELEDSDGTFFDHTSILPPIAQEYVGSGQEWSFYTIGDGVMFLGRRASATKITNIRTRVGPGVLTEKAGEEIGGLRTGEGGGIRVKQVFFTSDTFTNTIAKLFASVDGNGVNHATYDVLPFGAGIPWELLGQSFLDSLAGVEQSGVEDSVVLLIEKPTPLWNAVKSDFALRMAHPIWKDGGLRIAQLTVPNASSSDHTLDETNKSDEKRTKTTQTGEFLAHTLKIEYDRNPLTEKYQSHYVARDEAAYQNAGQSGVSKIIKARNSYSGIHAAGASVESLADMITSRFLPVLSKALKIFKRSIPHTLFHMAPGDTCTFSDDFIRNPASGERGVTNRAGIIVMVNWALGISSGGQKYFGECDILYTEEDRLFPLAPSCEHATVTFGPIVDGWRASNRRMMFHQHKFSDAAEANDALSFEVGDKIRITELDPADPTSADSFTDEVVSVDEDWINVASVDYDSIRLADGFSVAGNPAFDGTKTYLVNYDAYDQVQSAQQLVAFQADEADGQILDVAEPNLLGDYVKLGAAAEDITELPSRHSNEQFGDGEPFSASFVRDQIRMANSLSNFKTAPNSPFVNDTETLLNTAGASEFEVLWTFPYLIGKGQWLGGRQRKLNVAPQFRVTGGTGTVRVTSSASPPKGSSLLDVTFFGPKKQITFSTTLSTQWTVATAAELEIVRAENIPEMTWITVEGNDNVGFLGLAELWLGPLQ